MGIDIRQRAIDFSQRNAAMTCELLRSRFNSEAARQLGAACFQGSIVRSRGPSTAVEMGEEHPSAQSATTLERDAGCLDADPEAERVVLRVVSDLEAGRFDALIAHVKSSYEAARGTVSTRVEGVLLQGLDGSVVLEEQEVREEGVGAVYMLKLADDGTLSGTWTCGTQSGICHLMPMDTSAVVEAALEQCLVFQKANVFGFEGVNAGTSCVPASYDRIHVGANIPTDRRLELFRLLKPGGMLCGPMGDRMVLVSRAENVVQASSEEADRAAPSDRRRGPTTEEEGVQGPDEGAVSQGIGGGGDAVPAENLVISPGDEGGEGEFVMRCTMQVRYGDLIEPEKEDQELEGEAQGGAARAPVCLE